MKYRLRYLVGSAIIAGALIGTPIVMAETSNSASTDTSTTETATEMKDRQARLDKFKIELKINLSLAEKARLKLRCKPAQSVIAKLHTKFGNSVTTRTQAYTELSNNLGKLITKLQAKSVDTTTLEQEKTTLDAKISTYKTDLAAYQQALSDLKAVDCVADPDAFQAALVTARTAHDTLVNDAVGIRTYVRDTIKTTLQNILKTLEQSTTN